MIKPLKGVLKMPRIKKHSKNSHQKAKRRTKKRPKAFRVFPSHLFFRLNFIFIFLISVALIGFLPFFELKTQGVEADLTGESLVLLQKPAEILDKKLAILQDNTLLPISDPALPEPKVTKTIKVVVTGYSSTPWETDDDPLITAAGTGVRDGIIANNLLPFGTKVRLPEIYGDKIFVVEDRMHWRKSYYQFDVWFPDYWQALNFGAKRTYIEVLEG